MVTSTFTLRKYLKIWGQVVFYSLLFLGLASIFPEYMPISQAAGDGLNRLFYIFFPASSGLHSYWFVATYLWLMILSPVLNAVIVNLERKKLAVTMILLAFISFVTPLYTPAESQLSDLGIFCLLYLIAGYARIHIHPDATAKRQHLIFGLLGYICLVLLTIYNTHFMLSSSIIVVVTAMELFLFFVSLRPRHNKYVAMIGASAFGVYLIHENNCVRTLLWQSLVKPEAFIGTKFLVFFSILCCIAVFIMCSILETIRLHTVDVLWMKVVDSVVIPVFTYCSKIVVLTYSLLSAALRRNRRGGHLIIQATTWHKIVISAGLSILVFSWPLYKIYGQLQQQSHDTTFVVSAMIKAGIGLSQMYVLSVLIIFLWLTFMRNRIARQGRVYGLVGEGVRAVVLIGLTLILRTLGSSPTQFAILWSINDDKSSFFRSSSLLLSVF